MLSIERCKDILNKGIRKFSSEEIKEIRDYLYLIADIELSLLNAKKIYLILEKTLLFIVEFRVTSRH